MLSITINYPNMLYRPANLIYRTLRTPGFLLSFPKAGRTWLRFMLANYSQAYYGGELTLHTHTLPRGVRPSSLPQYPCVRFDHIGQYPKRGEERSMQMIEGFLAQHQNRQIGILARDPRDTIVSYYHHTRRWKEVERIQSMNIDNFVQDPVFGIDRIVDYLNIWAPYLTERENFKLFTYETFRSDPETSFADFLHFYQIPIDTKAVKQAVAVSSFENMKRVEQQGLVTDVMLQPADQNDQNSYKVRKGKVSGYLEELQPETVAYCAERLTHLDPLFQYH